MFEQTIQAGVFVRSGFRLSRGEHYAENKCEVLPDRVHFSVCARFSAASLANPRSLLAVLWLDTAHLRNSIFWQVDP